MVDLNDDAHPTLDDDCPLCRAMRESGKPIYTFGPSGELVPLKPREP